MILYCLKSSYQKCTLLPCGQSNVMTAWLVLFLLFSGTGMHLWRQIQGTRCTPQESNIQKHKQPPLQRGESHGPLPQTMQKIYRAWGKWQKGKKRPSVTSVWQVGFPSMFLKRSSLVLFEDAALESNCKSSFLDCTWYFGQTPFMSQIKLPRLHANLCVTI